MLHQLARQERLLYWSVKIIILRFCRPVQITQDPVIFVDFLDLLEAVQHVLHQLDLVKGQVVEGDGCVTTKVSIRLDNVSKV